MAAIVATAEVIVEFCAEHRWDDCVFVEDAVAAGGVVLGEGLRGEVFGYPMGVAGYAVVGGEVGGGYVCVGDGRGQAVFEDAGGVDGA